jgi:hypothetical protein
MWKAADHPLVTWGKPERDAHGEHGQGAGLAAVVREEPERQDHEGTAEGITGDVGET